MSLYLSISHRRLVILMTHQYLDNSLCGDLKCLLSMCALISVDYHNRDVRSRRLIEARPLCQQCRTESHVEINVWGRREKGRERDSMQVARAH